MTQPSDRLIHYLSLARTANPDQAAELVVSATADPHLFQFGELLSSPSLSSLQQSHPQHYNLLRLFAHGTVTDYKSSPHTFPNLTSPHWLKLRILTLLTLAHSQNSLHYETLLPALHLKSGRELEAVVIDAVYAQLIRARIHQSSRTVAVTWAVGRDVTPQSLADLRKSLTSWLERSNTLISEIEGRVSYIRSETNLAREAREKTKIQGDALRQKLAR